MLLPLGSIGVIAQSQHNLADYPMNKETATNGKGDSPRNCFSQKFRDNYDAIFGKKEEDEERQNRRTEKTGIRNRVED